MTSLPTGTITFLFTDIEGSTKLVHQLGDAFGGVLDEHHRILRDIFTGAGGVEVSTEGDAFFVVFTSPTQATNAAIESQRALAAHDFGDGIEVKVRMGLHTGEGVLIGDNYGGLDVHRAARISSAAHGGQVLISATTKALTEGSLPAEIRLKDLGEHRLKDIEQAEHLFQLCVPGLRTDFPPPRSLDARPNNLPAHLSSFVERDREIKEIRALLEQHRLVTLTGPGGTGKTRLSIRVAEEEMTGFADGAWLVPLAPVTEPHLVAATIAETLDVREEANAAIEDTLKESLSDKDMLLVLDNFEQIVAAAPLVTELLSAAPNIKVLVTSRATLRISGEQEYPVPPMTLPDPELLPSLEGLEHYESVALFLKRARSAQPSFELSEDNAAAIAEICARLDGLPLAIELAATRIKLLAPQDMLKRLKSSLSLLTGGARDLPQRQQTLRDAIAWSYDLLDEPMQAFFRRLGVFVGGWTFDAAEAVTATGDDLGVDAFEALDALVDNSLIRRFDTDTGDTRFRMLQTIRQYALEVLESTGELPGTQERHALYFLDLAERAGPELTTTEHWMDDLSLENGNLRAAFRWSLDAGRPEVGLRIGAAIWRYWQVRAHYAEGRQWMTELLAAAEQRDVVRARGLMALGSITYWQNDFDATESYYREGLEIFEELGDKPGLAEATYNLAFVYLINREIGPARERYRSSRALYEELDDEAGIANTNWGLAMSALFDSQYEEAEELAKVSKVLYEKRRDWYGGWLAHYVLYQSARLQGRYDEARKLVLEEVAGMEKTGDVTALSSVLESLSDVEFSQGYIARALRIAAAAEKLKEQTGGAAPPPLMMRLGDLRELATATLSPAEIESAWKEGWVMSAEEVTAYARKDPASG